MSNTTFAERSTTAVPDALQGRRLCLIWQEGPARGERQEWCFHDDGTVALAGLPTEGRVPYSCFELAEEVHMVSFPLPEGGTLTMALNFDDHSTMGVATRENGWEPVRGRVELLN